MLGNGFVTLREFACNEPHPLAAIQDAILGLLARRDDVVVCGAHAVNAYSETWRMTEGVDVSSTNAKVVADAVCAFLSKQLHITARVRTAADGRSLRVYQAKKPRNRNLMNIRVVDALPAFRRVSSLRVVTPAGLVAGKVLAYMDRRFTPRSGTDWRDIAVLLLRFPALKTQSDTVRAEMVRLGASPAALSTWDEIAQSRIDADESDDSY